MKVYISGPITGREGYMERFEEAERKLREAGYTVINPAKVNMNMPDSTTHSEYMAMSLTMLSMCDSIFMLKGWRESKGCEIEFEFAYTHNITIGFQEEKV